METFLLALILIASPVAGLRCAGRPLVAEGAGEPAFTCTGRTDEGIPVVD